VAPGRRERVKKSWGHACEVLPAIVFTKPARFFLHITNRPPSCRRDRIWVCITWARQPAL
jgi:hypothetical protein